MAQSGAWVVDDELDGQAPEAGEYEQSIEAQAASSQADQGNAEAAPNAAPPPPAADAARGAQPWYPAGGQPAGAYAPGAQYPGDPYGSPPQPYGSAPAAPAPSFDQRLLNPDVVKAREDAITAQFQAQLNVATDPAQQEFIRQQHALAVRMHRLDVKEAAAAAREWQMQQDYMQFQQAQLPQLRELAITKLMEQTKLSREQVSRDAVTGEELWDPHLMAKQAAWLAKFAQQQNVQQRQAAGTDRPYSQAGGQAAPRTDYRTMSDEEYERISAEARRTNGRSLLRRVS